MAMERDYVLGTHDEEISRLGLQHRIWRPVVLGCWQRAGIRSAAACSIVGAVLVTPRVDLAEIVGPTGKVVAVERSEQFRSRVGGKTPRPRPSTNVEMHELDLMKTNCRKALMTFPGAAGSPRS